MTETIALAARVQVFGTEHLMMLAVAIVGGIASYVLGRSLETIAARRFELVAGVAVLVLCVPFAAHDWPQGPELQICDFAWIAAAGTLLTSGSARGPARGLTRGRLWAAATYFWGLTLCVQGVLTPDLSNGFPSITFWSFLIRHLVPVWVGVYLVGARRGPSWRGFGFVVAITGLWAVAVMVTNAARGTNYGYLNGKPATPSLLDLLGPWPLYVVLEIGIVVGVWALMTWPWNRGDGRGRPRVEGREG